MTRPYQPVDMQRHIVGNEPHPYYDFQGAQQIKNDSYKATNEGQAKPNPWGEMSEGEETFTTNTLQELTAEERAKFYELQQMNPEASETDILLGMKMHQAQEMQLSDKDLQERRKLDASDYKSSYHIYPSENPWQGTK